MSPKAANDDPEDYELYHRKKAALESRLQLMKTLGEEDRATAIREKLASLKQEGLSSPEIEETPRDLGDINDEIESLEARAETVETWDEAHAESLRARKEDLEKERTGTVLETLAKVRDLERRYDELEAEVL
jgi:small-conductance mechanosensitive channel